MTKPCDFRHDWSLEELIDIHNQPLLELIFSSALIHRRHHHSRQVQVCKIISVKTGGCPEDCAYCAQSSRYTTSTSATPMLTIETVMAEARKAAAAGATRICLSAAWRQIRLNKPFELILEMIKGIKALGLEVCCTLGMLDDEAAKKLREAGLYAYNHNIDTSEAFYPKIATTRKFKDRLDTLDIVEKHGLSVCCGGIIGMGESLIDRLQMLQTLSNRPRHPESVPINLLAPIPGTPLEGTAEVKPWELIRMVATARKIMPKAMLRLSGGRSRLSAAEQALCFLAGANSIHTGEKLLTVGTFSFDEDDHMFTLLGLEKMEAYSRRKEDALA